jgi:predicted dienelactone hydrolase
VEALLQRAYEKAAQAADLSQPQASFSPPETTAAAAHLHQRTEMQERYERIKAALAASEHRAEEFLEEGQRHVRISVALEAEAAKRAEHVRRVMADAARAQEQVSE